MSAETTSTGPPSLSPSLVNGISEATVTFLFTDIQGSTELWERNGMDMAPALARHDAIMRGAIEGHGGHVFKALGDAFYAVFISAPDAVAAAVQAQQSLVTEPWALDDAIRVRMAIHSGTAERRGDDWFGPPLNRVARMLDAGHGGQILLSQAVEWLVAGRFPEGAALRDLGERTLKDLARPERIFQLTTEDLPAEFPPLHTLDARPHNLPVSPTPLVGREEEIAAVRSLFLREQARLVTLVGPGGTGKTRLGLQIAAELVDAFQHGVFVVNFAPVQDPALVAAEILQTLGEKPADDLAPSEALRRILRERQMLLVLDNFEQLVPAATFVGELLREAPDLAVLVTSQAALHVRGEHEFPVPPLPVPGSDAAPDPAGLRSYDAVALFVERARSAVPSFDLTSENAAAVAAITRQLDGLPLALELAAARIKMFPPAALATRLGRSLDFLTTGARDLPDRQRTLRGAIEWSYGLLTEEEKALFRRQAVFDGGYTLEAAEVVCSAPGAELDVVEGLASLLDKSLIKQTRTAGTEPRFERLRTIRAFAVEKLEASGEANLWRRRHAVYFADFAGGFNPTGVPAAEVRTRLDRLQAELENLRAAFAWSVEREEAALAVRLCNVLPALWFVRGSSEEAEGWVERALALGPCLSDYDRMVALGQRGRLAQIQGDNSPPVVADFEESLALARELGDEMGMARATMSLGNISSRLGEHDRAEALFRESLEAYRRLGDGFGQAGGHMNLGDLYLATGEIERAREQFERAIALARRSGDPITLAYAVGYLGDLAYEVGDMSTATERYEEGLAALREVGGGEIYRAWLIADLAAVAREAGQLAEARARFTEALDIFCERGYRPGIAHGILSLASVDALEGNVERAGRLFGASEALRKQATLSRIGSEQVARRIILERGREALSEEDFEALRAQGAEMSVAEALALAGASVPRRPA